MNRTATTLATETEREMVTFRVGDLLLGIDLRAVREINQQLSITTVPHAPDWVRGVVNLRGEVVTVLDLRALLNFDESAITRESRNIVVQSQGEQIGLLADSVGDVVRVAVAEIEPPPANATGADARFVKGVYKMKNDLLGILAIEDVLAVENADRVASR